MKKSLQIEWLGTAGFRFNYQGQVILLDPYITRIHDRVTPIIPDPKKLKKYIPCADFIIVSHSHYDHFADVPTIAKYTNAKIIGSKTTLNMSRSFNISEGQLIEIDRNKVLSFGNFNVTYFPSLHGLNAKGEVPFKGYVEKPMNPAPLIASDFLEGGTYAPLITFGGIKILQIGSANFIEEEINGVDTDILLLCIAWREKVPHFLERVIKCTNPKIIIPMHFDDYLQPIEKGMILRDDTSINEFYEEVKVLNYKGIVKTLDFFEKYIPQLN